MNLFIRSTAPPSLPRNLRKFPFVSDFMPLFPVRSVQSYHHKNFYSLQHHCTGSACGSMWCSVALPHPLRLLCRPPTECAISMIRQCHISFSPLRLASLRLIGGKQCSGYETPSRSYLLAELPRRLDLAICCSHPSTRNKTT